ncbi:g6020 [Coccomyxa viridis]|uniref:G6020 protein n=1 Tax=Coccomyxa viridis TaxID=1274662 RepID=A0ABP1FUC5_9CHLO
MSLDFDTCAMPAGLPQPPDSLLCPVSRCLLTEPVTLLNTGVTLQRASAQKWYRTRSGYCPVTGELILGWAVLQSNDSLRELVEQWAAEQGVSKEALDKAGSLVHRSASTSF